MRTIRLSYPFFVETNIKCSGIELAGDSKATIDASLVDPKRKFGFVAGDLNDAIAHLFSMTVVGNLKHS